LELRVIQNINLLLVSILNKIVLKSRFEKKLFNNWSLLQAFADREPSLALMEVLFRGSRSLCIWKIFFSLSTVEKMLKIWIKFWETFRKNSMSVKLLTRHSIFNENLALVRKKCAKAWISALTHWMDNMYSHLILVHLIYQTYNNSLVDCLVAK